MQGKPDDYQKWLDEQKNPKFSNFRLFAGGFCVWLLVLGFLVMTKFREPLTVAELAFNCCVCGLAVVWMKGK